MKCIKSLKETKTVFLGEIKRVDDADAETNVRSGFWKYVPKSEWKKQNNPVKKTEEVTETETVIKKNTKKTKK